MIGQSIPRQDALEKVTGRAQHAGDLSIGNVCHAKFLEVRLSICRSPRKGCGKP